MIVYLAIFQPEISYIHRMYKETQRMYKETHRMHKEVGMIPIWLLPSNLSIVLANHTYQVALGGGGVQIVDA